MIEPAMYIGIGLLTGCLIAVAVVPLVHERAVRLTIRRLEAALPHSVTEIRADKDLLRAEFAMSTRRLELAIEQLWNKTANQSVELGRKTDAINRLKLQRDGLKVELMHAMAEVAALKKELPQPRGFPSPKSDDRTLLGRLIPHNVYP